MSGIYEVGAEKFLDLTHFTQNLTKCLSELFVSLLGWSKNFLTPPIRQNKMNIMISNFPWNIDPIFNIFFSLTYYIFVVGYLNISSFASNDFMI